jgi:hypothetical protein
MVVFSARCDKSGNNSIGTRDVFYYGRRRAVGEFKKSIAHSNCLVITDSLGYGKTIICKYDIVKTPSILFETLYIGCEGRMVGLPVKCNGALSAANQYYLV